jgi:hypothetical protein
MESRDGHVLVDGELKRAARTVDVVLDDDLDPHLDLDGDVDFDPIVDLAP